MAKQSALTDRTGEVRELTAKDLKKGIPLSKLPSRLRTKIATRKRGPQHAPTKLRISIRLSREALEPFRATGSGWQTRIDAALRDWLATHSPDKPLSAKPGKRST